MVGRGYTASPACKIKPYARFLPGCKAIVVVGHDSPRHDVRFTLRIPLETMQLKNQDRYQLTDLWTDRIETATAGQIDQLTVVVPKDKAPGGGIRAIRLEQCPGA